MPSDRRQFLSVLAASAAAVVPAPSIAQRATSHDRDDLGPHTTWGQVRELFELRPDRIHMSGLLLASHPRPVRDVIARHRDQLQQDPAGYISHERWRLEGDVLTAAAAYLGVKTTELAMTDSTSMGLALLYSGLRLTATDEVLTTNHAWRRRCHQRCHQGWLASMSMAYLRRRWWPRSPRRG